MIPSVTLTMVDGVRVVVPDSLDLITPYVLREQQDWFEDEIKFLRHLLQPGQKVIDIGANYGVYALSMARTVGPTGHVWAFEPATSTAKLLAAGIAANDFSHVTLAQSALSGEKGVAQLSMRQHSELNALVRGAPSTGAHETVPVVTMDDCMETYGWQDIELVKIDAEGEEANILKGGTRFFAEQSPLVLYEIRAGQELHLELLQAFHSLGYNSYRLVPGLNLLVSFTAESPPDDFLLNLFCCKPDRAARLAELGWLLESPTHTLGAREEQINRARGKTGSHDSHGWRNVLTKMPYGSSLAGLWEQTVAAGQSGQVEDALVLHSLSRDASLTPRERFSALEASYGKLRALCESDASHLRLSSLSRVAWEYGARKIAAEALAQLCNRFIQVKSADLSEPFLLPGERFDSVPPGEAFGNWILSAAVEEFERISAYSSFYSPGLSRLHLESIRDLGFFGPEMRRRLELLELRSGRSDVSIKA
ncbi:MAG: FkbM family methyltransferase [Sulfuricaulis sp.]|uniref:FkbM family methyltransferase n=1 Tax=Sulfuricaulis sp. TaxID=2003553 RepID=UPI003C3AA21F